MRVALKQTQNPKSTSFHSISRRLNIDPVQEIPPEQNYERTEQTQIFVGVQASHQDQTQVKD
jgi:hypothetical protein